jgi:ferritin
MRPLISQEINSRLDLLVGKFFEANRIMDRGCSVLDAMFAMNKTSEILHKKLAHLYPQIADKLSTYQSQRNNLTMYPQTPMDSTDYPTPLSFFERMLNFQIEIENSCYEVCEFAKESDDYMTSVFLDSFMLSLIPVTHQLLLLTDKAEIYGGNFMGFDHRIEDFIIL